MGCILICVIRFRHCVEEGRKNPKVYNHNNNENYSTRCDIDNRLLQNMMRYHGSFKDF